MRKSSKKTLFCVKEVLYFHKIEIKLSIYSKNIIILIIGNEKVKYYILMEEKKN
jgi:hypothetical protein